MRLSFRVNLPFIALLFLLAITFTPQTLPAKESTLLLNESISIADGIVDTYIDDSNFCLFPKKRDAWLDRIREGTHRRLCLTANWIDGRFGNSEQFDDGNFRGKVSLAVYHDSIEGLDPKLRVRIKTKLPNVSSRLSAFIGKVDEDSYVSNTEVENDSFNCRSFDLI